MTACGQLMTPFPSSEQHFNTHTHSYQHIIVLGSGVTHVTAVSEYYALETFDVTNFVILYFLVLFLLDSTLFIESVPHF